jgi:hypothetical protein
MRVFCAAARKSDSCPHTVAHEIMMKQSCGSMKTGQPDYDVAQDRVDVSDRLAERWSRGEVQGRRRRVDLPHPNRWSAGRLPEESKRRMGLRRISGETGRPPRMVSRTAAVPADSARSQCEAVLRTLQNCMYRDWGKSARQEFRSASHP